MAEAVRESHASGRGSTRIGGRPLRLDRAGAALLHLVDSGIPSSMQAGDPDVLRRARIVLSFALVLILLGFEAMAFFYWALPVEAAERVAGSLVLALLLQLGVPTSLRHNALAFGANLVITGSWLVIVTAFTVMGGIRAPLLHWCALMPMLAILMGARASAWAWVGIGFATLGFFSSADSVGLLFADDMGFAEFSGPTLWVQRLIDVGSWIGILLAVALVYEAQRSDQARQLASQNAALASEIEQRGRAEERNRYLAYYDELTTLPNRRLFEEQLATAALNAARQGRMVGVMFLDLDGFKEVNDSFGHAQGDELLRQVAERLRGCVRLGDSVSRAAEDEREGVVSRRGGDEFTILLTGLRNHHEAAIVARRILRCLDAPFLLEESEVFISASIGVALESGVVDPGELLRSADLAMYHAKDSGKNNFQFFEDSMNADIVGRGAMANALRRAIDDGDLELHYQPIVAATGLRVVSVEALLRWRRDGVYVPPAEFVEIAEDVGLIGRLGEWVVHEACRTYAKWSACGIAPERIAVNVSGAQFRRGAIVADVDTAYRSFGVDPRCLEVEVTEGAMMTDEEEASRSLAQLKQLGVSIALDDFGTGFSSLSYVKRFPVDRLKIDRSFVAEVETDPEAQAIASAIIAMAGQLGLEVVGEGVETEGQERFLRLHGCDHLQGYRFGRPVPAAELEPLLAEQAGA